MSPRVTRELLTRWSQSADPSPAEVEVLNDLVARDQFSLNGTAETAVMSDRLKQNAQSLAALALHSLKSNQFCSLSFSAMFEPLSEIFSNAAAARFYGDLLVDVLFQLYAHQGTVVTSKVSADYDLRQLTEIWRQHNRTLDLLLGLFVPVGARGRELSSRIKNEALVAFKSLVLFGSGLGPVVGRRLQEGPMTSEEKLVVTRLLNAVDGKFKTLHLEQVRQSQKDRLAKLEAQDVSASTVVTEASCWLRLEHKAFEMIAVDREQSAKVDEEVANFVVCELLGPFLCRADRFDTLMRAGDPDSLRAVYQVFGRVSHGHEYLVEMVGSFVQKGPGSSLQPTVSVSPSIRVVSELLDFNQHLQRVVTECFNGDKKFRERIGQELQKSVATEPSFAKFLAAHFDYQLRQSQPSTGAAIDLLHYVTDKEGFESHYRTSLAMRLVNVTPIAATRLDLERAVVERLSEKNGKSYTRKMSRMLKDVDESRNLVADFAQTNRFTSNEEGWTQAGGVQFFPYVLTDSYWPSAFRSAPACLPEPVESLVEQFKVFYLAKHQGRLLRICAGASCGLVEAKFFGAEAAAATRQRVQERNLAPLKLTEVAERVELVVNSYQLSILYLLNSRTFVPAPELRTLGLPNRVLLRALAPIFRSGILRCISAVDPNRTQPDLAADSTDVLVVNDEFRPSRPQINLRKVVAAEKVQRSEVQNDQVELSHEK